MAEDEGQNIITTVTQTQTSLVVPAAESLIPQSIETGFERPLKARMVCLSRGDIWHVCFEGWIGGRRVGGGGLLLSDEL